MANFQLVDLKNIVVDNRARKDLGDIDSLAESIKTSGLIEPLVVFLDVKDGIFKLIAGGRRYEACLKAGLTTVPCMVHTDLNEFELAVMELMENLERKELTWAEEVSAKAKIHELQLKLHGSPEARTQGAGGWTQKDTALMLGETQANVSRDIQLSKALLAVPALSKCSSKQEALRLLNRVSIDIQASKIAPAIVTALSNRDNPNKINPSAFIIGDFFELSEGIEDESVDLVEIDPPYGIDLEGKKKLVQPTLTQLDYNEIPEEEYPDFIQRTVGIADRILKENGWLVMWFGPEPYWELVRNTIVMNGFKMQAIPGVWHKGQGQSMQPDLYFGNSYEFFFYARKKNGVLRRPGHSNVFSFPKLAPEKKRHKTQKPIALYEDILATFLLPGATVCVPFLGSGATLFAAHNLRMNAFGYDLAQMNKDKWLVAASGEFPYTD